MTLYNPLLRALRGIAWGCFLMMTCGAATAGAGEGRPPGGFRPRPPAQPEPPKTNPAEGDKTPTESKIDVKITPKGISLWAVMAEAPEVLTRLAKMARIALIVDDTVKEHAGGPRRMTLNLTDKKVSEILQHVASAYGLSIREVDGIFMVSDGTPRNPSSYLLSDIVSIPTQYVLANDAKALLPVFLQNDVKVNPDQNAVILSGPTEVLRKFRDDIKQFDIPAAQIMIEVLMVEFTDTASRDYAFELLRWNNNARAALSSPVTGQLTFQSIGTLTDEFHARLQNLVTQGKARVRAAPSIATVSGRFANIFIGRRRFLSTPVSMLGGRGDSGFSSSTNFIDAGVSLDMRPWTGGGDIIIWLMPEISTMSAPDPVTGLPEKSTRRASSVVKVRDGETIIIGGLQQTETRLIRNRLPILGDLPLFGNFFRSAKTSSVQTDLVIFVTPRVLSQTGHLPAEQEAEMKKKFLEGK
jgi:hypothetical protein